jgi:hypothetical protein
LVSLYVSILQGTIQGTGQVVDINVPTSRIPELPTTSLELVGEDEMAVWIEAEDKTVQVPLSVARQYFITGGPTPPHVPVLRGSELEIIVSADMLSKINLSDTTYRRLTVVELANKTYNLKRRGIGPLLTTEYNILPSGGFELTDVGDGIGIGDVFFADIYELNAGTVIGNTNSSTSLFNGIAVLTDSIQLNTVHYNKLLHIVPNGNNTYTLPDITDVPKPTPFVFETNLSTTYQSTISSKNGQLIYFGGTSQTKLVLGVSEHLWLLNGADGWYVLKATDNLLNVGKPFVDNSIRLNTMVAKGDLVNKANVPRIMQWLSENPNMLVSESDWQNTKYDASLVAGVNDWVYPLHAKFADVDTDTLRLPDYSDLAFVALKNYGGSDADRTPNEAGVIQKDMIREHQHEESIGTLPSNLFGRGGIRNVGVYGGSQSNGTADMTSKVGGTKTVMKNVGLIPLINI